MNSTMDPNPTNFPILSYVMARLPASISSLRSSAYSSSSHDIEQPPILPSSSSSSAQFNDPLVESMPHLKDPKIVSAMTEAVSEIAQTRSILQALGERPDHESIDIAKSKVSEIESVLASQLEEIALSSRSPDVDKEKEKLEREKTMYKAVVQLDEMHDAYEKLLRSAEEKLMKVYDSAVREKKEGGEEDTIVEEVNEEVVAILKDENVEKIDLSGRKLRIIPEAFGKLRHLLVLNLSSNQLQVLEFTLLSSISIRFVGLCLIDVDSDA